MNNKFNQRDNLLQYMFYKGVHVCKIFKGKAVALIYLVLTKTI